MPADICAFFNSYRDAFNRLDARAVSAHYDVPAIIAHAGGCGVFQDEAALNTNNVAICEHYATGGFLCADFEERAFIPQGERFCIADLAWKITRKGEAPLTFNTSYALANRGGAWKVFCVTAYEERRLWTENE
jgi:hypothetical protein